MKAKIDKNGSLCLERRGGMVKQSCAYREKYYCGLECPKLQVNTTALGPDCVATLDVCGTIIKLSELIDERNNT